ncbi:hypothetical protein ACJRO7_012161 [Eucalyptus globulus]|uniref:Protein DETOXIFICATION n=1 Tax=Eucalyptus globulus TaxID=34317 RepID=A0ABD3LN91_EUCGL
MEGRGGDPGINGIQNQSQNQDRQHEHDDDDQAVPRDENGASIIEEVKKEVGLSGPLIGVSLLQYSVQVISVMFVGRLGELPLPGASMATSFASVTGFSVLLGMRSALETLCGQAYGAKQHRMLGVHTQRAMLMLLCLSIPLAVIWLYTSDILKAFRQNAEISREAGIFNCWMIPTLFAYGLLQCLNWFLQTQNNVLQTQNNVLPMMMSSLIIALLHIVVCWVFIFKFGLGIRGAALVISILNRNNVILLAIYMKLSLACIKTWTGFMREALLDLVSFIKLAVPSAVMICLEYWSFELVVLLSGLLPNPKLETSVLSISLNTRWMVYMISSVWVEQSVTRVSNELGAGCGAGAHLAVKVMIAIAITEDAIVGIVSILVRHEVNEYVAKMMPLLTLSDFLDGFQCILPSDSLCHTVCVCFPSWRKGMIFSTHLCTQTLCLLSMLWILKQGLWLGIICGLSVRVMALVSVNACTNWDQEAKKVVNGAKAVRAPSDDEQD